MLAPASFVCHAHDDVPPGPGDKPVGGPVYGPQNVSQSLRPSESTQKAGRMIFNRMKMAQEFQHLRYRDIPPFPAPADEFPPQKAV